MAITVKREAVENQENPWILAGGDNKFFGTTVTDNLLMMAVCSAMISSLCLPIMLSVLKKLAIPLMAVPICLCV